MSITQRDLLTAFLCNMPMDHEPPTREEILAKAKLLGPTLGVTAAEDIEKAAIDAECLRRVTIQTGIILKSKKPHDSSWVERLTTDDWKYWNAYEALLKSQRRGSKVIEETASNTLQTLSWLQDPTTPGVWSRKGLVIGHVQSGKTSNFVGLISRSADAGYKFIVVLGGTLNSLRKQTQQRLDSDFIGVTNVDGNPVRTGVGKIRDPRKVPDPARLTSDTQDFNRMIPDQIHADIESFGTLIIVIKKNTTTLRNLKNWLQHSKKEGTIKAPMLMIDDEADYASVNTNDPSRNPTAINGAIREILGMFDRKAYVGYTATPFANIFINPDTDPSVEDDLFPEHFIQILQPPSDYFGSKKVFPVGSGDPDEEYETSEWIKLINEDDNQAIPIKHSKSTNIDVLPESLRDAVKVFVLTRAIRRLRGDAGRHCSMLVNISHLTRIHQQTAELLESELKNVRLAVTYCYNMEDSQTGSNEDWKKIKTIFNQEFLSIPEEWEDILPHLRVAVDEVVIRSIHNASADKLDYADRSRKEEPLVVIAVGGNTLSRGITLEDLTVSYLKRGTNLADSLLQMGRWFGYRLGYEDLCRIWLTQELLDWYHFITATDQDLRRQVLAMIRDNLEPKDFALRVRKHPDTLLLTAQNKMRNTQVITTRLSLAGKLREMYILSTDTEINSHNRNELKKLYSKLTAFPQTPGHEMSFRRIPRELISEFLSRFRFHPDWESEAHLISGYRTETSDDYPEWDVMFFNGDGENPSLEFNDRTLKQRNRRVALVKPKTDIARIPPTGNGYYLNRQRLGGRGDEGRDFSKAEIAAVNKRAGNESPVSEDYLVVRERPLLMLSLVELYQKVTPDDSGTFVGDREGIPAIGIGFPLPKDGKPLKTTEVIVNQAIYQRLLGALKIDSDNENESDDNDDN